jgi:hypothetical protein
MTRSFTMRQRSTAALRAGVIAAHLALGMAGTALAQSAAQQDDGAIDPSAPVAEDAADQLAPTEPDDARINQDPADILDAETLQELRRQNMRETSVDGLRTTTRDGRNDAQGIRVGAFILRPALTETLGSERTTTGNDTVSRTYLRSGLRASLTSDWSLHQLRIDGEGSWEKTLSGISQDDPEGKINAELRLDLPGETTATLRAGYSLSREEIGDPNATANAATQSEVNEYTLSAEVTRDLGILRTTGGIEYKRQTFGVVTLANAQQVDQSERNNNEGRIRGRIGYELSPALIPFIEASYGRILYDQRVDGSGYVRDADLYATKAGLEVDLGEKLKGELAGGYVVADFDDSALKSISAATIDGNTRWSPRRGTDLALNLRTEIEPTTTAGESGSTAYTATMVLSQVILENLTGQVSGGLTLRDYSNEKTPMQSVLALGTGLTWNISRSLDLNADVAWERTEQQNVASTEVLRAGIGLTLKR